MAIMQELIKAGLVDGNVHRADGRTLSEAVEALSITKANPDPKAVDL